MEHTYNESQRATEAEQEREEQDQKDIISQDHEFSNFEYSHAKAYSLALAAKMAYENSDIIKCEVKKWGFTQCRVVRYQNSKAYIASNDEMVLLVFCGTHPLNLRNYITDLQAHLVNAGPLGYVHSGFLEALGLRHVDEEEEEEAERQYRQEWQRSHQLNKHAPSSPSSSSSSSSSSSFSSSSSSSRGRNLKLSLMRGRRRASLTLPVVMRRDNGYRCSPAKLLRALPTLPNNLWSLMRFVVLWHRRQLLRVTGLHDYHEKLTTSSYNAPMYHQVIKILDELGVLQAYPFASSTPTRTKRPPPKRKLWVAGHSLGGALANLFSAQMVNDYPGSEDAIGGVYTFGQPRVGDLQYAQFVNEKMGQRFFRFVNGNDLIPRLPLGIPSWLIRRLLKRAKKEKDGTLIDVPDIKSIRNSLVCYLAGVATNHETSYKHAGQLKYIDYGGNIIEPDKLQHVMYLHLLGLCKLRIFKHMQRDTWLRLVFRMVLPFFMNDHLICDYARAIKDRMEEDRLEAEEAQKRVEADLVMEEGRASAMRGWFETLRPTPAATVDDKKNEDGEAQNENDASNEEVATREQDLRDDETPKLVVSSTRGGGPSCGIPRRKTTDAVLAVVVDAASSDSLAKTRRSESGGGLTRRRRWSTSQL